MKIAMYSTQELFGSRVTGGLKRFLELYNGFLENGVNVDLFCADEQNILYEKKIDAISIKKNEKSKNIFIPTEMKIFFSNFKLLRRIKANNYDCIIVFDVPTAISLCILNIKNINLFIRQDLVSYKKILLDSMNISIIKKYIYIAIMKICESICFIKSNKIVIQCKYDYKELLKRHRLIQNIIKNKSIIQINNSNPSWIIENSTNTKIKDIQDIHSIYSKKILFIGDFSNPRKGHSIFLEAVKLLKNESINFKAILVGDGRELDNYKEEYKNYPEILFTGRLSNPINILKQSDLLVVPSLADSCPNTIMEALYNNIPVIGANSGGIPEILNDEESIFELNPYDLKEKIKYLILDNNIAQLKESQKLRNNELTFNWFLKIINHIGVYDSCMEKGIAEKC